VSPLVDSSGRSTRTPFSNFAPALTSATRWAETLLRHDLIDELWLKIYPITLGEGKLLFQDGTSAAAFTLESTTTSPSGVIVANYRRAGEVKTGSF
jgi:dihydrofolate reductase